MKKITRKIITMLITVVIVLSNFQFLSYSYGQEFKSADGFLYTIKNSQVTITSYEGDAIEVEIPSEIEGYEVTIIGESAFENNRNIEKVVLPPTMKTLERSSFDTCSNLKEIVLNEGLEKIEQYAFYYCESMKNINLPDSLTYIGYHAFANCKGLESIIVPSGVTSILYGTFTYCENLTEVTLPDTLKIIEKKTFSDCESLNKINLPEGLEEIGEGAFEYTNNLEKIIIPGSVKKIPTDLFFRGKGLKEVVLNEGVEEIDIRAFDEATNLETVSLPSTLVTIGGGAFRENKNLKNITLPENLKSLGAYAFFECKSLPSINIPDSLDKIKESTFEECSNLTQLEMGSNIEVIENNAFRECISLNNIDFPERLREIGESTFFRCGSFTKIVLPQSLSKLGSRVFSSCWNLTDLELSSNLKEIPVEAFSNCEKLKEINIPTGVEKIYSSAFAGDKSVTKLTLPETLVSIGSYAFSQLGAIEDLIIPKSVKQIYSDTFSGVYINGYVYMDKKAPFREILEHKFGSDRIKFFKSDDEIEELNLNYTEKDLTINETIELEAIYSPSDREVDLRWTTNNYKVAVLDDEGLVIAKGLGSAVITVKDIITGLSATCKINVVPMNINDLNVSNIASKTYTGKEVKPAVSIRNDKGDKLVEGKDYTLKYENNTNVGKASVTVNGIGNYKGSKTTYFTIKPKLVTNLKGQSTTSSIKLTWSKDSAVSGYEVYKNDKKVSTIIKNSTYIYTDDKVSSATTYTYKVRSYKVVNNIKYYGSYTTITSTTKPLTAKVSLTKLKNNSIKIGWNKVNRVSGYEVYMATGKGGTYKLIKDEKKGNLSYTKTKLIKGNTYYFKVRPYKIVDSKKIYGLYSSVKYMKY